MNTPYILAALLLIVIAASYAKKNWRKWKYSKDLQIPLPAVLRTDIYFGYFGCILDQVKETKGAVNMLCEVQFEDHSKVVRNILEAGVDVFLGLCPQLLDRPNEDAKFCLRPDAEQRLRIFFNSLRMAGALKYVKAVTPIDEPNNTIVSLMELTQAVALIHKVCADYEELAGCKLYVIYAADKDFIGKDMFDWIGFDDYDMQSHVLESDKYKELKASLRPTQRTILVPGGCYGQNPTPFINFAHNNPEVIAILPFLWLDDQWGTVGVPGIRSNSLRDVYIAAGQSLVTGVKS